ncbi:hypothetical protein MMAN_22080 [Mycobacterium mantenii]|uniref:Transposase n=1 Tax=Mycobacterium mantenii TaxID=560555 RepID=A0ABN6A955_MYCNT|nr:hypothetical protein MMAN_22080 [Mycobacterium mantenii]
MRGVAELRCKGLALVVEDVAEHDAGSFTKKPSGMRGTHAARPAADQCHLVIDSAHQEILTAGRTFARGYSKIADY